MHAVLITKLINGEGTVGGTTDRDVVAIVSGLANGEVANAAGGEGGGAVVGFHDVDEFGETVLCHVLDEDRGETMGEIVDIIGDQMSVDDGMEVINDATTTNENNDHIMCSIPPPHKIITINSPFL